MVLSSATTVEEARWLVAHGADAVIAQGVEAGGHRGMFLTDQLTTQMGTFALLPQIVAAVDVPVIAAGGIANAAGVTAALALGATGVQVGTAYLCCSEATTSAIHRAALQSDAARHTALTTLFTGRPARGIVNRVMRTLGPAEPGRACLPTGHRRHGPAARPLGEAGQWRFHSAVVRPERQRLPRHPGGRTHPANSRKDSSHVCCDLRAKARNLDAEYSAMAAQMRQLALTQFGCLDFTAATEGDQEIASPTGPTKPASAPGSSTPTTWWRRSWGASAGTPATRSRSPR